MPPKFTRDIQRTLLSTYNNPSEYAYGAFTLYGVQFQGTLAYLSRIAISISTPHLPSITTWDSVCSLPFSIAFTNGISIDFFSCGY